MHFSKKVVLFFIFLVFFSSFEICPYISRIFAKESFFLPQFMTLCLYQRMQSENIRWSSSDENVATVDENGFVYGKNSGKVVIKSCGSHEKEYDVTVTEPNYVLGLCLHKNGDKNFKISVVTNSHVEKLKIVFSGKNISRTLYIENSTRDGECLLWERNVKITRDGDFTATAYASVSGNWVTSRNGFYEYNVGERRASSEIVNFIISCEGYRKKYYFDCAKYATIGCGKLIKFGMVFQDNMCKLLAQCELLNNSLRIKEKQLNTFLDSNNLSCNQHQFDGLLSFVYNIGINCLNSNNSTLRKILCDCRNRSLDFVNKDEFANEFLLYHHAAKKCVCGLMARRLLELDIFFYGKYRRFVTYAKYVNSHNYTIPECFLRYYQSL